jgi:hypothetical protein
MKAYGEADVSIHIFLTSALAGGKWSTSRLCRFTPEERAPGTNWIGVGVDPRAGLDNVEKRKFLTLPGLELRPLGRPARSHLLYRLRYPGSSRILESDAKFKVSLFFAGSCIMLKPQNKSYGLTPSVSLGVCLDSKVQMGRKY